MSETNERNLLRVAGAGCVGLYGLVMVALLVTVLVWRSTIVSMLEQYERESELSQADTRANDALRARLLARAGLDALLSTLRSGVTPTTPIRGVLGRTYDEGEDRYLVEFRRVADGVYEVEVTGQVTARDWSDYGREAKKVHGECIVEARVKVAGEQVSVVSIEAEDTSPAPPSRGD
jgi:hypothetical protein